jgi:hypothetical protein
MSSAVYRVKFVSGVVPVAKIFPHIGDYRMKFPSKSMFALVLATSTAVFAVETDAVSSVDAKTCEKACASTGSESTCPVNTAMGKLPKMTFAVGDESLCCSAMAKAKATEIGKPVEFVVGKEKFDSESKAFATLVSHTEKFVEEFTTPHTCSVSGNTTIAGETCACSVKAGELTSKVKLAMSKVAMSYKVGDKECSCPMEAAALAKAAGTEKTIIVDGEETTCNQSARLKMAIAKYKAAVLAMTPEASDSKTATN